jgi:ribosomal protein S18 acetylase RimI-like enzyme
MSDSPTIEWTQLRSDSEVPEFIDAAMLFHRPVLERLPPEDRPHFFDYWLRLLNAQTAYLARREGEAQALLTLPRGGEAHKYRWETATLGGLGPPDRLALPDEVKPDQLFLISTPADEPCVEVQSGYVRSLFDLPRRVEDNEPWTIRSIERGDLEPVLELLRRSYATEEDPDPSLHVQREELRRITENHGGWCWVATRASDSRMCGVVSYVAMSIPLAGVPGALVSDLAVDPELRGRGLARRMQHHAYSRLREAGQRWVFGYIVSENEASRRQAEALGREIWYRTVRFNLGTPGRLLRSPGG